MKKLILAVAAVGLFAAVGVFAYTQDDTLETQDQGRWCWLTVCDNY